MIEINLLPGKRKAAGAGFKFRLPDLRGIIATIKDPWLIGAIAAWVLVLGASAALYLTGRTKLGALEAELEVVKGERRRYNAIILQKRQLEKARDSLVSELTIIRNIDADRYIWPHVLDQVTKALPPYTWLTEVVSTSPAAAQTGGGEGRPAGSRRRPGRTLSGFRPFGFPSRGGPWISRRTPRSSGSSPPRPGLRTLPLLRRRRSSSRSGR